MKPRTPPRTGGFGTFEGVFRPVLLTMLGAMLYLREGWLVGNCGLLGALAIISAAYLITGTTTLSLATIATNTRVRPGGAFAIIAQALGVEVGGAVGIPLYIAQSASAAMYLYAFSEAWAYMFPTHPAFIVVTVAFGIVSILAWTSAHLAFRAQAIMMIVVVLALLSAFFGQWTHPPTGSNWIGMYPEASHRQAFAIFFPAATGIMVGVGMSGILQEPRKSIPEGTKKAWGVTFAIYVIAAFWYDRVASPEDLLSSKTIIIDRSLFGPIVLIGLLCSTLMASLSTLVAAPRLLTAMGKHRILPFGQWLAQSTPTNAQTDQGTTGEEPPNAEPRNATFVTLVLCGLFLFTGSLDAIAPIVTSFFIVTYLAINLVVLLEQRLAMISFRPTHPLAPSVPLVGVILCTTALLISSPGFGLTELVLVAVIYLTLQRRRLETPWETVRSGIAVTIAAWIARRTSGMARSQRAWQPDLLIPVADHTEATELRGLIAAITHHNGSARLVGVSPDREALVQTRESLSEVRDRLVQSGVYATNNGVCAVDFQTGASSAIELMKNAFFAPNLLLLDATHRDAQELSHLVDAAKFSGLGTLVYLPQPNKALGSAQRVSVWLSDRSPDWPLRMHNANLDLPILLGILLTGWRSGTLFLNTVITDPNSSADARHFLHEIKRKGRLPEGTRTQVHETSFLEAVQQAETADIHLFGLPPGANPSRLREIQAQTGAACLFVLDSGGESLLA